MESVGDSALMGVVVEEGADGMEWALHRST